MSPTCHPRFAEDNHRVFCWVCKVLLVNSLTHSNIVVLLLLSNHYSSEQLDGWTSHATVDFFYHVRQNPKKPFGILPCTWLPQIGAPCLDWSLGLLFGGLPPSSSQPSGRVIPAGEKPTQSSSTPSEAKVATTNFEASGGSRYVLRIQDFPYNPWEWDFDHQS